MHPTLTIVIPALEPDAELRRCIDSARLSWGGEAGLEIVVVVPGSWVAETRALFPMAVVCAESRRGIYSAMNDGAVRASGDFLLFLGKDDIVLPTLRAARERLQAAGCSALFCDVYWGDQGLYSGRPSKWRILGRNLCHQGILYSRDAFRKHGPYLRRMRVQADHLLNIRILWDRSSSVAYMAKPLVWYSGSGFSATQRDKVFWRLYPAVMNRHVGAPAACALMLYRRLRGK